MPDPRENSEKSSHSRKLQSLNPESTPEAQPRFLADLTVTV